MTHHFHLHTLLLASTIFLGMAVPPIHAQTPLSLEVTPPVSHLIIKPGTQTTHQVILKNTGTQDLTITPKANDFSADNATGTPVLEDEFTFSYLGFDEDYQLNTPFTLAAGQERSIPVVFTIPSSANEKEFHFVLLFHASGAVQNEAALAASIQTEIGSTFLITISHSGQPKGNMQLDHIQFSPFVDSFAGITPQIFIRNEGKTVDVAQGTLTIKDIFGTSHYTAEFFPTYILPQSKREVLAKKIDSETPPRMTATDFRWKPLLLLGPYTITVEYISTSGETAHQSVTIIALPFTILLLLSVSGTMVWFYSTTSMFSRKNMTK